MLTEAIRIGIPYLDITRWTERMRKAADLASASTLHAPVVLASGYITEDLRQRAPAAGVRELIYKPNTVDDLCEAVARYANAQTASGAYLPS